MAAKMQLWGLRDPWERRHKEPNKAYQEFITFRSMGRLRSISKLAKSINKSAGTLYTKSKRYNWIERAEQWDAEIERQLQDKRIEAGKEMAERHIANAQKLQEVAMQAIESQSETLVNDLTAKDIATYLRIGSEMERIYAVSKEEQDTSREKVFKIKIAVEPDAPAFGGDPYDKDEQNVFDAQFEVEE